jgi:hypothetical protein
MTFKNYIRYALKVHAVPMSCLLVLILGLASILNLIPNLEHQKEAAVRAVIPPKKEPIKGVPGTEVKKTDSEAVLTVAALQDAAPNELASETQNPKAYSSDDNTSVAKTESSPQQLVYIAESRPHGCINNMAKSVN